MKLRVISAIVIVVIVIVMTSIGVFIEKLNDNPEHPYTDIMITGVKENYTLNEPITFSVMVDGYGSGCGDTKAILTKENDSQYKSQVWGVERQCASFANPTNFKFNGLSANTTINQAGNYILTASFDDSVTYRHTTAEEKFSVIPSQVAKQSKTVNATTLQCENEFKPRETQHVTFPNGTSLTTNYVPVFLMKPNSTGKICITNNIASQSTDQSSISAKTTSRVSKDDSETSDVIVVPYPENIVVDNTTKTIVYTITTSNVANGFYRIGTTFDFCSSGIPMAVGYNSSHLFDNDFSWLGQTIPCPFNSFQSVQTQITGLTGIDVAYITKEYR